MISKSFVFGLLSIILLSFQNCSEMAFSNFQAQEKVNTLENNPIFPPTAGSQTSQPIVSQNEPVTGMQLPITTLCSTARTENLGTNAMLSARLEVHVKRPSGQLACKDTDTSKIKSNLKQKKISFTSCSLSDGEYTVDLINENNKNLLTKETRDFTSVSIEVKNGNVSNGYIGGTTVKDFSETSVLMDTNPNQVSQEYVHQGSDCDDTASPLYVDLRHDGDDTDILSSPEEGVLFDILGRNALPIPHTKVQISWFKRGRFALLALPDVNGQVNGIDQLFGNNTFGPDNNFSENGFTALAKFDANSDNEIDAKDPVFKKLKLWFDKNRNGIAEKTELRSLSSESIISIDLNYDKNFYERDAYGNEIKYKSVVRRSIGKPKPIFDVWFKL